MTSQFRAIPFQYRKIVIFVKFMAVTFLNSHTKFDLTDVPASIYDRKTAADPLTLSTTFDDFSVSRNLFSKAEMRQLGANGNQRIWYCRELLRSFSFIAILKKWSIIINLQTGFDQNRTGQFSSRLQQNRSLIGYINDSSEIRGTKCH